MTARRECAAAAAEEVSGHIRAQVEGGNNFEFVAVIVKGSDNLYGAYQNGVHTDYTTEFAKSPLPNDKSSIAGIVHNHVWAGTTSSRAENRYPSDDDWDNLTSLVFPSFGDGANPNELSMFLLDPFGTLREFKYSQKDTFQALSSQQRINGDNLPNQTNGCES